MLKIYLAGPMRGIPNFNFPAFDLAAAVLRAAGHEVISPAEMDREEYGDAIADNATGSHEQAVLDFGFDFRSTLANDLIVICEQAYAVVLLPGWSSSKGASAEVAVAQALSLRIGELTHDPKYAPIYWWPK